MTKGKKKKKQEQEAEEATTSQRGRAGSPHSSSLEPQLALVGLPNRGGKWLCSNYTSKFSASPA